MNQKVLIGLGLVVVLLLCGVAFWLGRSSSTTTSVVETPPPLPPTPKVEDSIDVEPSLKVGSRVEALSAEGWMPGTIQEINADQALIRYERAALGEERLDVRLLRKPESEIVAGSTPPPAVTSPPAVASTPPAPTLGPRPAASAPLPPGTYQCEGSTNTIVILDDHQYGAFGEETGDYAFDPATNRITWQNGPLAGQSAQFVARENTIVSTMGAQALACALRR